MSRIQVLPIPLRNKIAAGEVIERPASVVKELIENSIDAASTEIRIEILRGGKGLIKVTDNGSGMDREDAILSLERHATSKLGSEDDLFNIRTMGFRGEALPSIASVSRMRITTGVKGAASGATIALDGGVLRETKDAPSLGTSVEVRELFFNTPARKKFLKSDSTEMFHIIDTVTKEALSHWEIGFTLYTENQETMILPPASGPKERITQIYGLDLTEGLLEVKSEQGGITMTALVSKGENFRNAKSHQFVFVNRRPVKDQTISHAVYRGFEGILPEGKHPVFFLFVEIDPRRVDFNVHPTKREVRFENRDEIHRFVSAHLREAIRTERAHYIAPFAETMGSYPESTPPSHHHPLPTKGWPGRFVPDLSTSEGGPPYGSSVAEPLDLIYRTGLPFVYLGDTFIATAGKGGLMLIDHHAAHERILYERLLRGTKSDGHPLLFPKQMRLSANEYAVIIQNRETLREMGIEIEDFGQNTVLVRSLPDGLQESDIRGILMDVAAALTDGIPPNKSLREAIAARVACHSSVRGKEILNQEELGTLLSDLDKTESPDQCPHGRPTRLFFSLDDLKKMFKRK